MDIGLASPLVNFCDEKICMQLQETKHGGDRLGSRESSSMLENSFFPLSPSLSPDGVDEVSVSRAWVSLIGEH